MDQWKDILKFQTLKISLIAHVEECGGAEQAALGNPCPWRLPSLS